MSAVLLYPSSIRLTGHPGQHGVADLALVLDTNSADDIHVVLTADLMVDLLDQLQAKVHGSPHIRLVNKDR